MFGKKTSRIRKNCLNSTLKNKNQVFKTDKKTQTDSKSKRTCVHHPNHPSVCYPSQEIQKKQQHPILMKKENWETVSYAHQIWQKDDTTLLENSWQFLMNPNMDLKHDPEIACPSSISNNIKRHAYIKRKLTHIYSQQLCSSQTQTADITDEIQCVNVQQQMVHLYHNILVRSKKE